MYTREDVALPVGTAEDPDPGFGTPSILEQLIQRVPHVGITFKMTMKWYGMLSGMFAMRAQPGARYKHILDRGKKCIPGTESPLHGTDISGLAQIKGRSDA